MNVLLVSECDKRALVESRRVLDQFAERCGERTWRTVITHEGLDALHRILRRTARKNTAVACHWLHGPTGSELMWIVGDARRFDADGRVATGFTHTDILRRHDEDDWHRLEDIRLVTVLAGLFHDIGKANEAFQRKLTNLDGRDVYRHEWVSLRLFEAVVGTAPDDAAWLQALAGIRPDDEADWLARLVRDGAAGRDQGTPLASLPPLARWVGWLIVTHHGLPRPPVVEGYGIQQAEKVRDWIAADWGFAREPASADDIAKCWHFGRRLPLHSQPWRRQVAKTAAQMLNRPALLSNAGAPHMMDPLAANLSRLALMLADHHYSSLPRDPSGRHHDAGVEAYANTRIDRDKGMRVLNQWLDEHLVAVGGKGGAIVAGLPALARHLPHLGPCRSLRRRSDDPRFHWQDRATDVAAALRDASHAHGFFGVCMASTGCGKTLANARIMAAMSDPQRGPRFVIALGLRTLTLQTGRALRERLGLGESQLAVMVGGGDIQALQDALDGETRPAAEGAAGMQGGSASAAPLLPPLVAVDYGGKHDDSPIRRWLPPTSHRAAALIEAPVLVCTVDHLMPATEGVRGGHQILPQLRLLSSDVVLDEVDDFDLDDLPALARLVRMVGLLGGRLLLSSATMAPDLLRGLFLAYADGRRHWQSHRRDLPAESRIQGFWSDEFGATAELLDAADARAWDSAHGAFITKRVARLQQQPTRRRPRLVAVEAPEPAAVATPPKKRSWKKDVTAGVPPLAPLIAAIRRACLEVHQSNAIVDPASGKRLSLGVVRMANIGSIVPVALDLLNAGLSADVRLHLCVYHAAFPLLLRSAREVVLDRCLRRHNGRTPLLEDADLRAAWQAHPEGDQVFVVLASPVVEVGRDHDYDWAVIEPSSFRSIIQMAGRVRRHRDDPWSAANLALLQRNALSLRAPGKIAFCRPGFEREGLRLRSHDLAALLRDDEWKSGITAIPRILRAAALDTGEGDVARLADLEHLALERLFRGSGVLSAGFGWRGQVEFTGLAQARQRFRKGPKQETFVLALEESDEAPEFHSVLPNEELGPPQDSRFRRVTVAGGPHTSLWNAPGYADIATTLAQRLGEPLSAVTRRYGHLVLHAEDPARLWSWNEALGVWRE